MTYFPNFDEFKKNISPKHAVPVCRQLLADVLTPVSAYQKISTSDYGFLFESATGGEKMARYSFLAAEPYAVFECRGRKVTISDDAGQQEFEADDPLAELEKLTRRPSPVKLPGMPPFLGGAVGYMSYDVVRLTENLPNCPSDTLKLPDIYFCFYDTIIAFDHLDKTVKIISLAHLDGQNEKEAYDKAIKKIERMTELLRTPTMTLSDDIRSDGDVTLPFDSNFKKSEFEDSVRACKEYVKAGDIFQVVLSQRLHANTSADPYNIYRALRVINPSPYMFYLQLKDLRLIGSSPEVMVRVENGKITLRPIAGTRPRGKNEQEDKALAEELLADPKERAEHIMLLDLGRNDVGRVSKFNTVRIEDKMIIERYSHVMHITSSVSGQLRDDCSVFDALRASLPAGTLSGAPKVRAMEILDELEPEKRGPYGGAVGYVDFSGNLNTCITIRTIVLKGQDAYVQAGAGIVADSVPELEYEETRNKAKALLKAIEVAQTGFTANNS